MSILYSFVIAEQSAAAQLESLGEENERIREVREGQRTLAPASLRQPASQGSQPYRLSHRRRGSGFLHFKAECGFPPPNKTTAAARIACETWHELCITLDSCAGLLAIEGVRREEDGHVECQEEMEERKEQNFVIFRLNCCRFLCHSRDYVMQVDDESLERLKAGLAARGLPVVSPERGRAALRQTFLHIGQAIRVITNRSFPLVTSNSPLQGTPCVRLFGQDVNGYDVQVLIAIFDQDMRFELTRGLLISGCLEASPEAFKEIIGPIEDSLYQLPLEDIMQGEHAHTGKEPGAGEHAEEEADLAPNEDDGAQESAEVSKENKEATEENKEATEENKEAVEPDHRQGVGDASRARGDVRVDEVRELVSMTAVNHSPAPALVDATREHEDENVLRKERPSEERMRLAESFHQIEQDLQFIKDDLLLLFHQSRLEAAYAQEEARVEGERVETLVEGDEKRKGKDEHEEEARKRNEAPQQFRVVESVMRVGDVQQHAKGRGQGTDNERRDEGEVGGHVKLVSADSPSSSPAAGEQRGSTVACCRLTKDGTGSKGSSSLSTTSRGGAVELEMELAQRLLLTTHKILSMAHQHTSPDVAKTAGVLLGSSPLQPDNIHTDKGRKDHEVDEEPSKSYVKQQYASSAMGAHFIDRMEANGWADKEQCRHTSPFKHSCLTNGELKSRLAYARTFLQPSDGRER